MKFFDNKYIFAALAVGLILLSLVIFVPALAEMFKVVDLSLTQLGIIGGTSIGTFVLIQLLKLIKMTIKKK